ncbi:hypothetical protein EcE24377A_0549 [Escherichia coli O139:H28 str. E24377A]|uniref:Uncharacterized protein n=1 Tax=Escherichia coli O139:H28 (strain E24377A / ETEC) TaxID=331111 RepID=A7ZIS0_ECO24|nr:hypothetical protein EcE24377A_0549 [Escherichia coli O139:H28 str. E24377A]
MTALLTGKGILQNSRVSAGTSATSRQITLP